MKDLRRRICNGKTKMKDSMRRKANAEKDEKAPN